MTDSANNDDERRQSFRIDMEKELVDITWTDKDGNVQQRKIICLDFSRGGLKLDCDQLIPIGTQVKVVFKVAHPASQELSGKVVRNIEDDSGWFHIALLLDK
jgi:c-di-GMP-binding flagellar brake protein YcgR